MATSALLLKAKSLLNGAKRPVLIAGAGLTHEIGSLKSIQPEDLDEKLQSISWYHFHSNPEPIMNLFHERRKVLSSLSPSPAHNSITKWAQHTTDSSVIDLTTDGLLKRSFSSQHIDSSSLFEPHGNVNLYRCFMDCHDTIHAIPPTQFEGLCYCPHCATKGRPHVLFWHENYEETGYRWITAFKKRMTTDCLILAGTSASRSSVVATFASTALARGVPVLQIGDLSDLEYDISPVTVRVKEEQEKEDQKMATVCINAPCKDVLPELLK